MNHRIDHAINSIIGLARILGERAMAAQEMIEYQIRQIDGFPAGTEGPKVSTSSGSTPTERAAQQRFALMERRDKLNADIDKAIALLRTVDDDCGRILGGGVGIPRCTGGYGSEGAKQWGDTSCHRLARREGLCDTHYMRRRRWRERRSA